ncbi:MAG: agmatinase [Desulfobacterales bacterium]|nr:MAG: agmatinase [Desulfobacterales bacterium]
MNNSFPRSPYAPPKDNFPFTGIATFAGYPLWQSEQQTDAVVLGIPYDEGTTYRPGTRFGPRAIRDASMFYSYDKKEDRFYDADRRKWILSGKTVTDAGDVPIEPLSLENNWRSITRAVASILDANAIPAVLGGDHSITYPVVKAFEGQSLHYVHFDTHADCDRMFASNFTHGSPVLHVMENGRAESVTLIGIRGLTNSPHDVARIQEQGVTIITARELRNKLLQSIPDLFKEGNYYVSLDIDFFDPSAAPGTGTPEPGGLFFPDFSDVIHLIADRGNIIGFDVVEVNPQLDGRGAITAHLAARCVLELMSAALDSS